MGSVSHCIKHVKMCNNPDFQVHGTNSILFVKGSPGKIPHSKNIFGGIF